MSRAKKLTTEELFNHLFGACNILRGPINQDDYKNYITPILFFKRISDVYDEETQEALEISDGDEEFASFPENHRFQIPDGCHWRDVRNTSSNVGLAIANAMNGIERANPDTLGGVFSSFDEATWTDKNKLSDERLKNLVEHMSKVNVGNNSYSADIMGDSYEYLIKKFADLSKKNAAEFYTPREIVNLMVRIIDPKPGETVYDPACGTGGMLIEAIKNIDNDALTYGKIYGQENNLSTSAIARMNLFLHGARDFNIKQGDTLRAPAFLENEKLKTFDCVLANPPFSLKKWGAEEFSSDPYGRNIWGTPSDSNGDFAWLQHMVQSMDPDNGRCAVVLPQGVLFRQRTEGKIREELVKSDKLEAVITLVDGIFFRTGVSACILILNNKKVPSRKGKVCMIDATQIYTAKRAQNYMSDDDVDTVFNLLSNYQDVEEKVKIVTIEDIAKRKYTLSMNSYIEYAPKEVIDPAQVTKECYKCLKEVEQVELKVQELMEKGGFLDEQSI